MEFSQEIADLLFQLEFKTPLTNDLKSPETYKILSGLNRHFSFLITHYQKTLDEILTDDQITAILYFYHLHNFLTLIEFETDLLLAPVTFLSLTQQFLAQKQIKLSIDSETKKQLNLNSDFHIFTGDDLKSENFKKGIEKLLLGCFSGGQFDLHVGYFVWKHSEMNGKPIELRSGIIKCFLEHGHALEEFMCKFDLNISFNKNELKRKFLSSISNESQSLDFLKYIENNFGLLIQKTNVDLFKRTIKLIFYGVNVYKGDTLAKYLEVLTRLITRNIYVLIKAEKVCLLSSDFLDFDPENYRSKTLLLTFPSFDILKNKPQAVNQLVSPEQLMQLKNRLSPSNFEIAVITKNFKVEKQLNYIIEQKSESDIMKISGKDFNSQIPDQNLALTNTDLLIKIFKDPSLTTSSLLELSNILHENNRNLFWKFSQDKLEKLTEKENSLKVINAEKPFLFSYHLSKQLKRLVMKTVRKFKLGGLLIDNFIGKWFWKTLEYIPCSSIDKFSERLRTGTSLQRLQDIFTDLGLLNPFYLAISKKLQTEIPGFQFASNDLENSKKIGWKYLFKPFSSLVLKNTSFYNLANFLNSEFGRKLGSRPLSENFLMSQKHAVDSWKDAVVRKFYSFLYNKLSFYVVSQGSDIYFKKLQSDACSLKYSEFIQSMGCPVWYFPLYIEEASLNNSVFGCVFISKNKVLIFLEKFFEIELSEIEINASMISVYKFLKKQISDSEFYRFSVGLNVGKQTVYFNFYELFKNKMNFKFSQNKFVCDLTLFSRKETEISQKVVYTGGKGLQHADYNFLSIKHFLQKFKKEKDTPLNSHLKRMVKLLTQFKVKSADDLNKLFQLKQISQKKKNYDIFALMLSQLSRNFCQFSSILEISKDEIDEHLKSLCLGNICVITPEYGEFIKVGGLAVMIEDLCNGLIGLGETVSVVLPYYNIDKNGQTDYLSDKGVKFVRTFHVSSRYVNYEIGIHVLKRDKITFYFLHNYYLFPEIYKTVY